MTKTGTSRRLPSQAADERAHAARAILEITEKEPEILDPKMLGSAIKQLRTVSDKGALRSLLKAADLVKETEYVGGYKYGL